MTILTGVIAFLILAAIGCAIERELRAEKKGKGGTWE